jgi:hypothetical protein
MSQPSPGVNVTRLERTANPCDPHDLIRSRPSMEPANPGRGRPGSRPSTLPIIDQQTPGENLWITCQQTVGDRGSVNSSKTSRDRPSSDPPGHAGTANRVIHKFSPGGQGTLCPVKLFGIIELFERCRGCPRRRAHSTMNAMIR